jgi:hypothetical protein
MWTRVDMYDERDMPVGKRVFVCVSDTKRKMRNAERMISEKIGSPVKEDDYDAVALCAGEQVEKKVEVNTVFLFFCRPLRLYTLAHECEHALQFLFPELYLRVGQGHDGEEHEQLARWMGCLVETIWEKANK